MGVSVYQGTFNKRSGSGSQTISGLPFQPKAIIFWGTALTGTSPTDGLTAYYGFTDGTTDCVIAGASEDNVATSDCSSFFDATNCIEIINIAASNTIGAATLTSFNSDGFTLNWSISDTSTDPVHFWMVGGTDITDVKAGIMAVGTASPGNKSYTGVGFQPDVLLTANNGIISASPIGDAVGSSHVGFGLSAMKSTSERWATMSVIQGSTSPAKTCRYQRIYKCFSLLNNSVGTGSVVGEADFVSFDADGFTWNYTTTGTNITNSKFIYLAIKGGIWNVGSQIAPGSDSDTTTWTTNGGPTIKGILTDYIGLQDTAITPNVFVIHSIGGSDGTRSSCIGISDINNANPTGTVRVQSTTFCSQGITGDDTAGSSSLYDDGTVSSFTGGNFVISWTNVVAADCILNYVTVAERDPAAELADTLTLKVRRPITQSVSIVDSITIKRKKSLADTITSSSALLLKVKRPIADTIANLDIISIIVTLGIIVRTAADTISISDSITAVRDLFRSIADIVANSDILTRKVKRPLVDVITNSDSITTLREFFRSIADTVSNTDVILLKVKRPISDAVTISDGIVAVFQAGVVLFTRSIADTITNSDSITTLREFFRSIADTITNSDILVGVKIIGVYFRSVSDTITNSDILTLKVKRPITDTITILDSIVKRIKFALADSITNSDTLTATREFFRSISTDSLSNSDILTLKVKRPISDAITNSDIITRFSEFFRALADTISNSDALVLKVKRPIVDAITNSDTITSLREFSRSITADTITNSDTLAAFKTWTYSITDSLSNTDALVLKVKRTIMDTITNTDILVSIRNFFRTAGGDTITITDLVRIPSHFFESVADTVIISDIINFVRLFVGGTRRGLINLSQRFNRR